MTAMIMIMPRSGNGMTVLGVGVTVMGGVA